MKVLWFARRFLERVGIVVVALLYGVLVLPLFSLYGYIIGGCDGLAIAAETHRKVYLELLPGGWRRISEMKVR